MSFASPVFLWYFMPATLAAYWLLPRGARNGLVAVASLLFYVWGAGAFVLLLLGCIAVNFAAGLVIDNPRFVDRPRARIAALVTAIVVDLGILAIWKYGTFGQQQFSTLSKALGGHATSVVAITLPIGISFFTFHHLSYVVDVFRRSRPAQRSPVQFVTYIAMFPQLIAGPIVRYHEIADQLGDTRRRRFEDLQEGFPRFALGLAKKVVVADSVAKIANAAFDSPTAGLTTAGAWLGALAYAVQIYFDFSGYSDMAIGLGRMFGFRLPENFNRPYSALSITDFWRRWHMSLSRWFRDYLYIPLGGNRGGALRTYRNLYVVFALTGLWHGAAWSFLVWGLYHGTLLVVERATGLGRDTGAQARPRLAGARRALTFLLVLVGWVPFRAHSLGEALRYLERMFSPHFGALPDALQLALTESHVLILVLALTVVLLPRSFVMGRLLDRQEGLWPGVARFGYAVLAAPYAAVLVAAGTFSPFLYFQF